MLNVRRAFFTRLFTFPITAMATFVTTALVIHGTDSIVYGSIALISSIFTLMPYADFGMGAVVINTLAEPDIPTSERLRIIGNVFRWLLVSGFIIILVGISGATVWSWNSLFHLQNFSKEQVDLATAICVSLFGVSVPFSIGQRILTGLSRNDVALAISATTSIFTLFVTFILVVTSSPGIYLATAVPTGILLSQILSFIFGLKKFETNLEQIIRIQYYPIGKLLKTAAPMLFMLIILPFALNAHKLILARQSTGSELSAYTMSMQLYSPLWSFVAAAAMSLWPMFANERKRKASAAIMVRKTLFYFALGGLVAMGGMVMFGNLISSLISRNEIHLSFGLVWATGFLLLVQTLQQIPGMFLTTNRGLIIQSFCVASMAVVSIAGSWLLSPVLGAVAPSLVTGVAVLTCQVIPGLLIVGRQIRAEDSKAAQPIFVVSLETGE